MEDGNDEKEISEYLPFLYTFFVEIFNPFTLNDTIILCHIVNPFVYFPLLHLAFLISAPCIHYYIAPVDPPFSIISAPNLFIFSPKDRCITVLYTSSTRLSPFLHSTFPFSFPFFIITSPHNHKTKSTFSTASPSIIIINNHVRIIIHTNTSTISYVCH
jgi:hypothetical protein